MIDVKYTGPFRDAGGYAKMNREIVRSLCELGVNVQTSVYDSGRKCYEVDTSFYEALSRNSVPVGSPSIHGALAPGFLPAGQKNIVFTMMETQNIIPSYVQKCNCAGELWLPCEWNMETFKASGVKAPMYKVPLGVNTDLYCPEGESIVLNPNGEFVFLSAFGWSLRKGPDVLIQAFLRAFGDNPNVKLAIFSRIWGSTEACHVEQIRQEIQLYKKRAGYPDATNIEHVPYGLPEEDMPKLFRGANCFVLPSRGEGFGLPYIEAGSCEVPVIATRHGGQLEFLDDDVSYLVDIEGYDKCKNYGLNRISSFYGDNTLIAKLGEKTIEELAQTMHHVYTSYDEACAKARNLRKKLEQNFTWKHTALRIIERLSDR